jgi:predicted enzyme related to lactoylglutathione lyase
MDKNVICWFEIYVDDMNRAKKFYGDVFGFAFEDTPAIEGSEDYKMAFFPCEPDGSGVSGALVQMGGTRTKSESPTTLVYFPSEDCSIEAAKVEAAGGTVKEAKMALGEHGFCSICIDSEGNAFGIHSQK